MQPSLDALLLRPQAESLQDALRQLYVLDAIDVNGQITGMPRLPMCSRSLPAQPPALTRLGLTQSCWLSTCTHGPAVAPGPPFFCVAAAGGRGGQASACLCPSLLAGPCAGKGKAMAQLPLDPSLSRALLAAKELGCLEQVGCRGAWRPKRAVQGAMPGLAARRPSRAAWPSRAATCPRLSCAVGLGAI